LSLSDSTLESFKRLTRLPDGFVLCGHGPSYGSGHYKTHPNLVKLDLSLKILHLVLKEQALSLLVCAPGV